MVETVSTVIANSSLLRIAGGQDASSQLNDIPRSEVQTPQAPFISPRISIDNNFNTAVIQIRDSDTGDVLTQFPSETRLQARAQEQALQTQPQQPQQQQVATPSSEGAEQQQIADTAFVAQSIDASLVASAPQPQSGVAQAQIASAALTTGAQSGQISSGNVNVTA